MEMIKKYERLVIGQHATFFAIHHVIMIEFRKRK